MPSVLPASDTCLNTEQTKARGFAARRPDSRAVRVVPGMSLALLCLLTVLPGTAAQADPAEPAPITRPLAAVIDDYVRVGLRTNRSLQSSTLDIERSQAALDAARSRYIPEVGIDARYTRAEGGREITLPVAALGNPTFSLVREREQDTRLTLRQPLFAPAIPASVRAQRAGLEASEFARLALARRLKRDISVGYLDWLQASRAIGIVTASRTLLVENLRVNDSLFRNGKITQDQVLRARAELLAVEQQLREAQNSQEPGAQLPQLPAEPRTRPAARECRAGPRRRARAARSRDTARSGAREPPRARAGGPCGGRRGLAARCRALCAVADAVSRCRCRHAGRSL
jgi:hypothetical protein